jgi:tetratricopeptide (TPR) repeat protein
MARKCNLCQSSYDETLDSCPACAGMNGSMPSSTTQESPLSAEPVVERPSRIAIEECEVAAAAAQEPKAIEATESAASSGPPSNSEFDLFLLRLESPEAERPAAGAGEAQPLLARDPPGNFGVHVLEDHGLVETNLEIDLEGLVGSIPPDGVGEPESALEGDPVGAISATDGLDAEVVAASLRSSSSDGLGLVAVSANGDRQGGRVNRAAPREPEADPVFPAALWAAPGASVQPMAAATNSNRSDSSWFKGTIFGFVVGTGLFLGMAATGVHLPAGLGNSKENSKPPEDPSESSQALVSNPLPEAEPAVSSPAPDRFEQENLAGRWKALFLAADLAREKQYNRAVRTLQDVMPSTARKGTGTSPDALGKIAPGDDSFVIICRQLLAYWRLQADPGSAERGQPPGQSAAVQSLLIENKQLRSALDQVGLLLNLDPPATDVTSLEKNLKQIVHSREAAAQRAGELEKALVQARMTLGTLEQRASSLGNELKHSEEKLSRAERELEQARAAQKLAPQQHTALRVAESQKVREPVEAYAAYARGLALYRQGNRSEAQKNFVLAARLDDQDARYYYMLGLCRWQLGERDQATADFRQAIGLEQAAKPSGAFVRAVLQEMPAAALDQIERLRRR